MNLFDVFILLILGFGIARGILRGLLSELSSIMGVLFGFHIAYTYYELLSNKLALWINNQAYVNITGFLIIFITVILLINIITLFIKYLMNLGNMSWINRLCGGFFGFLKGGLIVAILLIVFTAFLPLNSRFIKNSHLSPYLVQVSEITAKIVSPKMKINFSSKIKGLKSHWNIEHPR